MLYQYATYSGASPFSAPATLAVIPFAEQHFGGWYPTGGMYKLAEALARIATKLGVDVRTNCPVSRVMVENKTATGVLLKNGETVSADAVVANSDVVYTYRHLIEQRDRKKYTDEVLDKLEPGGSGMVLLLGVEGRYPALAHHTKFMPADYTSDLTAMFETKSVPDDPCIYVCASTRTDPTQAPAGCENLFVLASAPAIDGKTRLGPPRENLPRPVGPDAARPVRACRVVRPDRRRKVVHAGRFANRLQRQRRQHLRHRQQQPPVGVSSPRQPRPVRQPPVLRRRRDPPRRRSAAGRPVGKNRQRTGAPRPETPRPGRGSTRSSNGRGGVKQLLDVCRPHDADANARGTETNYVVRWGEASKRFAESDGHFMPAITEGAGADHFAGVSHAVRPGAENLDLEHFAHRQRVF